MADLTTMTTAQLLDLLTNTAAAIKAKVVDEFAGSDVPNIVNEAMDEIAGSIGHAQEAIGGNSQAAGEVSNAGPSVPQPAEDSATMA